MQPEDIDKLFRDRLRNHAPTPPAHLWDQLEAELKPARKRPAMWLYAAAAVIALLLVAGYGVFLQGPNAGLDKGTLAVTKSGKSSARVVAAGSEKNSSDLDKTQATAAVTSPSRIAEAVTEASPDNVSASKASSKFKAEVHSTRFLALSSTRRRAVLARTLPPSARAASLHHPTSAPDPAVAANTAAQAHPERPAAEAAALAEPLATTPPALAQAVAPTGQILVEVRRGDGPGVSAYASTTDSGRPRLGRLLLKAGKKVGNAVLDGRQVNLPKVEIPEIVTAQVEAWTSSSRP